MVIQPWQGHNAFGCGTERARLARVRSGAAAGDPPPRLAKRQLPNQLPYARLASTLHTQYRPKRGRDETDEREMPMQQQVQLKYMVLKNIMLDQHWLKVTLLLGIF